MLYYKRKKDVGCFSIVSIVCMQNVETVKEHHITFTDCSCLGSVVVASGPRFDSYL